MRSCLGEGRIDIDPLMVLTGGQCPLGVAGVFVFFTISGYLVTGSCEATGSTSRFLAKRALRIYPGLAFCLVLLAFVLGPLATSLSLGDYFADAKAYGFVAAQPDDERRLERPAGRAVQRLGRGPRGRRAAVEPAVRGADVSHGGWRSARWACCGSR